VAIAGLCLTFRNKGTKQKECMNLNERGGRVWETLHPRPFLSVKPRRGKRSRQTAVSVPGVKEGRGKWAQRKGSTCVRNDKVTKILKRREKEKLKS